MDFRGSYLLGGSFLDASARVNRLPLSDRTRAVVAKVSGHLRPGKEVRNGTLLSLPFVYLLVSTCVWSFLSRGLRSLPSCRRFVPLADSGGILLVEE